MFYTWPTPTTVVAVSGIPVHTTVVIVTRFLFIPSANQRVFPRVIHHVLFPAKSRRNANRRARHSRPLHSSFSFSSRFDPRQFVRTLCRARAYFAVRRMPPVFKDFYFLFLFLLVLFGWKRTKSKFLCFLSQLNLFWFFVVFYFVFIGGIPFPIPYIWL